MERWWNPNPDQDQDRTHGEGLKIVKQDLVIDEKTEGMLLDHDSG